MIVTTTAARRSPNAPATSASAPAPDPRRRPDLVLGRRVAAQLFADLERRVAPMPQRGDQRCHRVAQGPPTHALVGGGHVLRDARSAASVADDPALFLQLGIRTRDR